MLGHLVSFTYCMAPGSDLPCRKILDCWHARIDIEAYLGENFTQDEIKTIIAPPQQKVVQLLELVNRVKHRGS